jgi:hypothetical protein
MPFIQDWIHRIEVEGGTRYFKFAAILLALLALVISYNWRGFKNMSNPEAMDAAQLARNISEHHGYKTLFVRPFSIHLLEKAAAEKYGPAPIGDKTDRAQMRDMHPDISNAPAYPLVLAGLMKVMPFKYAVSPPKSVWNRDGRFWIYQPDFLISLFNQFLFLIIAVMLFFFARSLFDDAVAWTSAAIFLGTDLFWRFSISGLSTMMLLLIFLALAWSLTLLEKGVREANRSPSALLVLAVIIGLLMGLGTLTRYSFGFLIVPMLLFLLLFPGRRRVMLSFTVLAVFGMVIAPWMLRNYHLSHTPFGTAQYAMFETIHPFEEHRLQRSLNPDLTGIYYTQVWYKLIANLRAILTEDLPRLGGNWISAFFLVGLLIRFKNQTLSRLRYFLLFCLPVLMIIQALGRTQLTDDSPVINSENLLVLLAPLIMVFGVCLFYILLEQMHFPAPQLRYLAIGLFVVIICLPMIFTFFSPRTNAIAYPPYDPPVIQRTAGWMKNEELVMSDVPWAMAWYGKHQCIWLTLDAKEDFFAVNDYKKTVNAIYFTPLTMDGRFLTQWLRVGEHTWGSLLLDGMTKQFPPYFPLTNSPSSLLSQQIFLTDRNRWKDVTAP